MWLPATVLALLCGALVPVSASAVTAESLRAPLLAGAFNAAVAAPAGDANPLAPALAGMEGYYRGLAAFALKDYATTVATLAGVAEQHGAETVGLKAAVVATLALSRNGDRENACRYAAIVQPLTARLSPIWQVWIAEAKRTSSCE